MSWVGVAEIAAHIGVSPHTIRKWCQRGLVPHGRAGRKLVFEKSSVESWMRQRGGAGQSDLPATDEKQRMHEASVIADEILSASNTSGV